MKTLSDVETEPADPCKIPGPTELAPVPPTPANDWWRMNSHSNPPASRP